MLSVPGVQRLKNAMRLLKTCSNDLPEDEVGSQNRPCQVAKHVKTPGRQLSPARWTRDDRLQLQRAYFSRGWTEIGTDGPAVLKVRRSEDLLGSV